MTTAVEGAARRRFEAPRRSGECSIEPSSADWDSLWHENLRLFASFPPLIADWRRAAQRELHAAALRFTQGYRSVESTSQRFDRLILAGHQPSLFHPGVWFKNFLLSHLGRQFAACPIQLIVDNDLLRQPALRVPGGSIENPRLEHVAFDRPTQIVPFEVASVSDMAMFLAFCDRVADVIHPFVDQPMIKSLWPTVLREYDRYGNVGLAMAAARNIREAESGLGNLELPLSAVCQTNTFRQFVAHVVTRAPEFAESHNRALAEYRRRRRLRSVNHPVPDLSISAHEFETPFWVWSKAAPVRKRLYMRSVGDKVLLLNLAQFTTAAVRESDLVGQIAQLEADGIAIRPRALITTMYARLILGDLFVHGIGGAAYDAVTDEIIRRFFMVEPPRFLTATATIHLPVPCPDVDDRSLMEIDGETRALRFHPEKFVGDASAEARRLIQEKIEWVHRTGENADLKQRHEAIDRLNQRLHALLANRVRELGERRTALSHQLGISAVFGSREYSFALFPAALADQLSSLVRQAC